MAPQSGKPCPREAAAWLAIVAVTGCAASVPRAPEPSAPCAADALRDGTGACVAVVRGEGAGRVLDVGHWIVLALGQDRGPGTPRVCSPLVEHARALDGGSRPPALIDVRITLTFPDNDVASATTQVRATARGGWTPWGEDAGAPFPGLAESLEKDLRSIGGEASTASATVGVRCELLASAPPVPAPDAGDAARRGGFTHGDAAPE